MGRSPRAVGFLCAALIALATSTRVRADPWETTRKTVIDPINSEFHRHLPQYIKARDLPQILSLYATEGGSGLLWDGARPVYAQQEEEMLRWGPPGGAERIRDRYQRLLDLFPTVDKAELRIHRIYFEQEDKQGYPADVRLIVRGTRADGSAAVLDQRMRIHIARASTDWRITQEDITARELVARREPRFVRDHRTSDGAAGNAEDGARCSIDQDRDGRGAVGV